MDVLRVMLVWFKAHGIAIAVGATLGIALFVTVVVYRFVDEVLSIAQRGYFLSVPALKYNFQGNKTLEKLEKQLGQQLGEPGDALDRRWSQKPSLR